MPITRRLERLRPVAPPPHPARSQSQHSCLPTLGCRLSTAIHRVASRFAPPPSPLPPLLAPSHRLRTTDYRLLTTDSRPLTSRLSPLFPLHTTIPPVSPLFPLDTKNRGVHPPLLPLLRPVTHAPQTFASLHPSPSGATMALYVDLDRSRETLLPALVSNTMSGRRLGNTRQPSSHEAPMHAGNGAGKAHRVRLGQRPLLGPEMRRSLLLSCKPARRLPSTGSLPTTTPRSTA